MSIETEKELEGLDSFVLQETALSSSYVSDSVSVAHDVSSCAVVMADHRIVRCAKLPRRDSLSMCLKPAAICSILGSTLRI